MTGSSNVIVTVNMGTKVVQVTNIAPQATRDQMQALFGYVGKIEEIRLYPTMRDVSLPVQSRICYVKYFDPSCVGVAQHLTNTVFIDRALIVTPYQAKGGEIPDEYRALDIATQANVIPGLYPSDPKLPAHIVNQIEGIPPNQVITTHDPVLVSSGLPLYPPLPITYDARRIEEIRRTLVVISVDESISGEQLIEFFQNAGDVKYVRFCTRDNDSHRYALVEFNEQASIVAGLRLNGSQLAGKTIQVYHSTQAIAKPMAKSNEAAQREIEEAMTRVKEAQSMISAAIDPVIGILSKDKKRSRSSSRSRRHSRSRSRRKSRSRSKYRRRSRSRSHRSKRRSRSRHSSRRSRSRGKRRSISPADRRKRSRPSPSRKRSSRDRKRSRSRGLSRTSKRRSKERRRSPSKERRRSASKERRRRRSVSKERRHSSSKERRRSASKERRRSVSKERRSSVSKERRNSVSKERRNSVSKDRRNSVSKERRHSVSKERRRSTSKDRRRSVSRSKKSRSKSKSRRRSRSRSNRSSRSKSRRPHTKEEDRPGSSEKRAQSKSKD